MSRKILVADDSVVIQKSIGITFAQEDFQVTFVGNGEEAFQRALELKPDLILADTSMPKLSGAELCKKFRQEAGFRSTPILLLANSQETFSDGQLKSFGANDFIQKPFESNLLLEKVKALFSAQPSASTSFSTPKPTMEQSLEQTFSKQPITPEEDTAVAFQEPRSDFGTSLEIEKSEDYLPDAISLQEAPPAPSPNTLASLDVLSIDDDDDENLQVENSNFAAFEEEPTKTVKATDVFRAPAVTPETPVTAATQTPVPSSEPVATSLQLTEQQIEQIVSKVFQNVIERIAWEVVPDLAERIIKEELQKITSDE